MHANAREIENQLLSVYLAGLAVAELYSRRPRALRHAGTDIDCRNEEELDYLKEDTHIDMSTSTVFNLSVSVYLRSASELLFYFHGRRGCWLTPCYPGKFCKRCS